MHHTGSQENEVGPEEQEETQEQEPLEAPEPGEELQECPDHRPSTFEKGKPRSILSLLLLSKVYLLCYIYCCIKYRSCDETFAACLLHPCPDNPPHLGYRVRIE